MRNIYRLTATATGPQLPRTPQELRARYHDFVRKFCKQPIINTDLSLIIRDPSLTVAVLKRLSRSKLNDLDQESLVGEPWPAHQFAANADHVQAALELLRQRDPLLFQLLRTAIHSIALSSSTTNRLGQRAHGGSTNNLIGLIWLAVGVHTQMDDLLELLVHELTHTLVFLDELNHPYFNYTNLPHRDYWSLSAILGRNRPMDKAVHSVMVAAEIINARVVGVIKPAPGGPAVHPSTADMKVALKKSCAAILNHPKFDLVCTERVRELVVRVLASARRGEEKDEYAGIYA
jgi:hypothetical protein